LYEVSEPDDFQDDGDFGCSFTLTWRMKSDQELKRMGVVLLPDEECSG
jgi:hypothetical protein